MQEIKNLKELGKIVGVNSMNKLLLEYMKVVIEKVNEMDCSLLPELETDQYGNNTNFPNSIMSDMTTKGLLGKWTGMIASEIEHSLLKYHIKTNNIDVGCTDFVRELFTETMGKIQYLTPVLEDLVNEKIFGMEDIFIAVYGIGSDEVYMFREFRRLFTKMEQWDEDYMWADCSGDSRLKAILLH